MIFDRKKLFWKKNTSSEEKGLCLTIGSLIVLSVVGLKINSSTKRELIEKDNLLKDKEIEIKNLNDLNNGLLKQLKNSSYQLGKLSRRRG